ncbi:MAG: restriction endonuclease subunit S, partial [Thermoplasmata archaeon]|nr:restriction endonuclease subunit S [Thermoplasmata archaeon]
IEEMFPDEFKDSELGEIPRGWRTEPLDEIADFLNGLALQKYPPHGEESLPVIKIAQLRAGHPQNADRADKSIPPQYIIDDGDVLFSWSGSLELSIWCGGPGALNQHLFKVTSADYPKWFFFFWVDRHLPDFRAIAASKATTMGHIQRQHLSRAQTIVPTRGILDLGDRVIAPLLDRMVIHSVESRTLATIRDTLLPKLLSGEIRVNDAEKFLRERGQ